MEYLKCRLETDADQKSEAEPDKHGQKADDSEEKNTSSEKTQADDPDKPSASTSDKRPDPDTQPSEEQQDVHSHIPNNQSDDIDKDMAEGEKVPDQNEGITENDQISDYDESSSNRGLTNESDLECKEDKDMGVDEDDVNENTEDSSKDTLGFIHTLVSSVVDNAVDNSKPRHLRHRIILRSSFQRPWTKETYEDIGSDPSDYSGDDIENENESEIDGETQSEIEKERMEFQTEFTQESEKPDTSDTNEFLTGDTRYDSDENDSNISPVPYSCDAEQPMDLSVQQKEYYSEQANAEIETTASPLDLSGNVHTSAVKTLVSPGMTKENVQQETVMEETSVDEEDSSTNTLHEYSAETEAALDLVTSRPSPNVTEKEDNAQKSDFVHTVQRTVEKVDTIANESEERVQSQKENVSLGMDLSRDSKIGRRISTNTSFMHDSVHMHTSRLPNIDNSDTQNNIQGKRGVEEMIISKIREATKLLQHETEKKDHGSESTRLSKDDDDSEEDNSEDLANLPETFEPTTRSQSRESTISPESAKMLESAGSTFIKSKESPSVQSQSVHGKGSMIDNAALNLTAENKTSESDNNVKNIPHKQTEQAGAVTLSNLKPDQNVRRDTVSAEKHTNLKNDGGRITEMSVSKPQPAGGNTPEKPISKPNIVQKEQKAPSIAKPVVIDLDAPSASVSTTQEKTPIKQTQVTKPVQKQSPRAPIGKAPAKQQTPSKSPKPTGKQNFIDNLIAKGIPIVIPDDDDDDDDDDEEEEDEESDASMPQARSTIFKMKSQQYKELGSGAPRSAYSRPVAMQMREKAAYYSEQGESYARSPVMPSQQGESYARSPGMHIQQGESYARPPGMASQQGESYARSPGMASQQQRIASQQRQAYQHSEAYQTAGVSDVLKEMLARETYTQPPTGVSGMSAGVSGMTREPLQRETAYMQPPNIRAQSPQRATAQATMMSPPSKATASPVQHFTPPRVKDAAAKRVTFSPVSNVYQVPPNTPPRLASPQRFATPPRAVVMSPRMSMASPNMGQMSRVRRNIASPQQQTPRLAALVRSREATIVIDDDAPTAIPPRPTHQITPTKRAAPQQVPQQVYVRRPEEPSSQPTLPVIASVTSMAKGHREQFSPPPTKPREPERTMSPNTGKKLAAAAMMGYSPTAYIQNANERTPVKRTRSDESMQMASPAEEPVSKRRNTTETMHVPVAPPVPASASVPVLLPADASASVHVMTHAQAQPPTVSGSVQGETIDEIVSPSKQPPEVVIDVDVDDKSTVKRRLNIEQGQITKTLVSPTGSEPSSSGTESVTSPDSTNPGTKSDGKTTPSSGGDFICGDCERSFKTKAALKSHFRTHTKEKPFECDVCGKHFSQKCNLKKHIYTHFMEKEKK